VSDGAANGTGQSEALFEARVSFGEEAVKKKCTA
jgi:hypothetical protein